MSRTRTFMKWFQSRGSVLFFLIAIVAALGLGLAATMAAEAAIVTVTSLADSGANSLRQAIALANAGDTITFGVTGTITLDSELVIGKNLTIDGPGAGSLTISGTTSRVFKVDGGVVTIQDVTISNGVADFGGGISNNGTLTVSASTLSGNTATNFGGGGIFNQGTLTVSASTLSGNTATNFGGGGIENLGMLTVSASTLSGNTALQGQGGGILNLFGTLTVSASTLSGNTAPQGGGIENLGTLTVKNSIIANSPSGGNCSFSGAETFHGDNLSTDGSCTGFTPVTSAALNLGALANNGGPTRTHALLPGSVAIDAVTDCTDLIGVPVTTDQRGIARPQGAKCDVGAFEAVLAVPFAGFASAKLEIDDDDFEVKLRFTLRIDSNGIAPLTEAVRLQLGTFSTTIPAGSFTFKPAQPGKKGKPGKPAQFTFAGVINGVALEVKITDLGNKNFEFKAEGEDAALTGLVNPIQVTLTIGDDFGTVAVMAELDDDD